MKKHLCLLALLFYATIVFSQTQYGYVKTKGRMVNGEYVRGDGLPGATVFLKGNKSITVIDENGSFCFPVSAQTFMVESVRKNGYELIDVDVVKRPYSYSSNPIYLVMETPEQQKQDQLDAVRKIRRTMEIQLHQLEDELEEKRTAHEITLEEYQQALQKLYNDQNNSEKLIAEMAKQYAQMDYDQMDELNQRISDAILNGRLTEADSLLRTKGDLRSRVTEIRREQQSEAQRETEIAQEQQDLAVAKTGTQKKLEDIAADCYKYFDLCKLNMEWDSAAYYITFRAELDTANAQWQYEAASYCRDQHFFDKAETYYMKALNNYSKTFEENKYKIGVIKNDLANIYVFRKLIGDDEILLKKAIDQLNEAADIFSGEDSSYMENGIDIDKETGLMITYMNLFSAYYQIDTMRSQADSLSRLTLEVIEKSQNKWLQDWSPIAFSMIGVLQNYAHHNEYEKLTEMAIATARQMALNDTSNYGVLAYTLSASAMSSSQYDFRRAESLMLEALDYYRLDEYYNGVDNESNTANVTQMLGLIYLNDEKYQESERWYLEALPFYRRNAELNPYKYNGCLYGILIGLGQINKIKGLYDVSDTLYQEALNLDLRKAFLDPIEYDYRVADIQSEIGKLKLMQNPQHLEEQIEDAFPFFCNALEKYKYLVVNDLNKYAPKLVEVLYYLGLSYTYFGQFEESEMTYNEAIEICHRMSEEESPDCDLFLAWTQSALGDLYSHLDSIEKGMIAYDEAVEVYERLYPNKPELKEGYVGTLGKQSFLAIYLKEFAKAEQQAEMALNIDPSQHWIFSSLAASKLFQGKYDEAEEVYCHMKPELKDRFLQDLSDFEAAGVIPELRKANVERIRKMLLE